MSVCGCGAGIGLLEPARGLIGIGGTVSVGIGRASFGGGNGGNPFIYYNDIFQG